MQCTDDDYDDDDNDDDDGVDDKRYEITLKWCESEQHIVKLLSNVKANVFSTVEAASE